MKPLLSLVLLVVAFASALAPGKPNIIVVVSDDQGYGEFSCHGNPVVRTPCLDRLHDQSVRFTNFHVAPMCTPTRAQLMTGRDAVRTNAVNVSSGRTLLRRDLATMPDLLRRGGYTTALFGKWHLGDNYPYRPQDRGFEEVVTYPSSHISSVPDFWQNDYFDDTYLHNGRRQAYRGYTTDVFFDEAMAWMRAQKAAGKPFFTYLATAAPHGPHFVPQKYRDAVTARLEAALPKLPPLAPGARRQLASYLAMIENLDENMGRLEDFLAREDLRDDTLLVFLTDNGTTFGDQYFPAGMRGKKVTLWEGGHRVPLFVRWPHGGLGAPRDVAPLTQVQDLLPTLLELAEIAKPERVTFDGMSLAPLLRGTASELPDRALFVNYSRMPVAPNVAPGADPATACEVKMEGAAVLWQQWRWLENRRLYDVQADPLQERDVAAQHPEIAAALRRRLEAWWQGSGSRVNEPQPVVIGNEAENPAMLTACEWWNVFVDQQGQVRRGERKNGSWHLVVDRAGDYEFELRRWPREAALALTAAAPAVTLTDGRLDVGQALAIAQARLRIAGAEHVRRAAAEAQHIIFRLALPQGPATMEATFLDDEGQPLLGAYYVYVRRLPLGVSSP
ncbi:MAG: arylsulfatase [Planctomycetes bacterium]|jgi:arylsulfatase|nr:arylsulfatase [Planctomycetota bacterium]